jgi:hypothetical protein
MKTYTHEQKLEALKFFEDGCTAREIFEVTQIPIGTLYRWKSEGSSKISSEDLRSEDSVEDLRSEIAELRRLLEDIRPWALRKIKAEARENEYKEATASGFVFKRP